MSEETKNEKRSFGKIIKQIITLLTWPMVIVILGSLVVVGAWIIAIIAISLIVIILLIAGVIIGLLVGIIALVATAIIAILFLVIAIPSGLLYGVWQLGIFLFAINPILGVAASIILYLLLGEATVGLLKATSQNKN